jgi:hypothetical protein
VPAGKSAQVLGVQASVPDLLPPSGPELLPDDELLPLEPDPPPDDELLPLDEPDPPPDDDEVAS